MASSSHEDKAGIAVIALPLLIMLFWSVPWKSDPRTAPATERLLQLRTSQWSWDQAEYKRLQDAVDFDTRMEGLPLLIALGPVAHDSDMFQRMVSRKANLNSSDWGCTPLLAALDSDFTRDDQGSPIPTVFSGILLRAGADPNLLPSSAAVDRRLATQFPKDTCRVFDGIPKERRSSILRIFIEETRDPSLIELLLEKGAKPRDAQDAQAILGIVTSRVVYKNLVDPLMKVTLKHGASLDDDASSDTLLTRAIVLARSGEDVQKVIRLLERGADPNRRTADGELPLQFALDQCIAQHRVFGIEEEDSPSVLEYVENQWRTNDKEARGRNVSTLRTIEALLRAGANPNLPLKPAGDGESLLAYAVKHCPSDVPRALVGSNARVTEDAIRAAHVDLRRFLEEHGVNKIPSRPKEIHRP